MASMMTWIASSFVARFGANPPSSPTAVFIPLAFRTLFRLWNTSAPILSASLNVSAPTGMIMNSWKSTVLSAWEPPLRMFIIGVGRILPFTPPRYWKSGRPTESAAALATAMETPRIAFAPSLPLLGVPSRSIRYWSRPTWSNASHPMISSAMISLTFSTAFRVPLPRYLSLSPSLSSTASCTPVDAPDGTIALPSAPSSRSTSTSTVGLPLESRTSLAITSSINAILFPPVF